jgi:hypothetical protein
MKKAAAGVLVPAAASKYFGQPRKFQRARLQLDNYRTSKKIDRPQKAMVRPT